ncbi:hypothetical protein D918_04849 [Trichuris suis]|nr:hypothetical protein D918_04849 [Trichuris suis]
MQQTDIVLPSDKVTMCWLASPNKKSKQLTLPNFVEVVEEDLNLVHLTSLNPQSASQVDVKQYRTTVEQEGRTGCVKAGITSSAGSAPDDHEEMFQSAPAMPVTEN